MRPMVLAIALLLAAPHALALSPPSAPQTPSAMTGANVGEIDLSWSPPASSGSSAVAGYRIYRMTSPTGLVHYQDVGNILAFTDNAVPDAAPRYYRFSAVNGDGEGPLSATVVAQALHAPTPPQNFTAWTGPSRYNITLVWDEPQYDGLAAVTQYRIYRAAVWSGPFSLVASVPSTNTTFRDTVLSDNATFAYEVTAVNAHGESLPALVVNGTTAHAPSAPQNVRAGEIFPISGIFVEWEMPADEGGLRINWWRVDRSVNGGPYVAWAGVNGHFLHVVDDNCQVFTSCTYRVAGVNVVGLGAFSDPSNTVQGDALPVINRCAPC